MKEDEIPPVPPLPSVAAPAIVTPSNVVLTTEQLEEIVDHINRKSASPTDGCPVCGSPNNSVLDHIYQVSALTTVPMFGGTHQPLIATACYDCGFVRFFNRLFVDALIKDWKSDPSQPAPDGEPRDGA